MTDKHECAPENATKMLQWIKTRGGVAIWRSVNLSNLGASWSTPALTPEGQPYPKPTWQADSKPERIITDATEIEVVTRKEVRRFHVGVRQAGLAFKLTDASSRRLRDAVAKAGKDASHAFDYEAQDAIVTVPDKRVLLSEWIDPQKACDACGGTGWIEAPADGDGEHPCATCKGTGERPTPAAEATP